MTPVASERVTLQSYRDVFRLADGRRLYAFGDLRIADVVPGGLPLRAIAYFLAAVVALLMLGALPAVGEVVAALPWQLRYLVLPGACAALGALVAPDGRVAHRFLLDWVRFHFRRRRSVAGRAVPREGDPAFLSADLRAIATTSTDGERL